MQTPIGTKVVTMTPVKALKEVAWFYARNSDLPKKARPDITKVLEMIGASAGTRFQVLALLRLEALGCTDAGDLSTFIENLTTLELSELCTRAALRNNIAK